MPKKENNKKSYTGAKAWAERKQARNCTPERKERQRQYRIHSIQFGGFGVITHKQQAELARLES